MKRTLLIYSPAIVMFTWAIFRAVGLDLSNIIFFVALGITIVIHTREEISLRSSGESSKPVD